MSQRNWGRTILGGTVGFVLGLILGVCGVMAVVSAQEAMAGLPRPEGAVGVDIRVFLYSPVYWAIVTVCAVGLGYVAGRNRRRTIPPGM